MANSDPDNLKIDRRASRRNRERANRTRDGLRHTIASELGLPTEELIGFRLDEMHGLARELSPEPAEPAGLPYHQKGGHLARSRAHQTGQTPEGRLEKTGHVDALTKRSHRKAAPLSLIDQALAADKEARQRQQEAEREQAELLRPDPIDELPDHFRKRIEVRRPNGKSGRDIVG